MLFRNGNLPDSDSVEPGPGNRSQADGALLANPWYGRMGAVFSVRVIKYYDTSSGVSFVLAGTFAGPTPFVA